jgi:glycosyltransferase involved in cell wall biosynthesis
VSATEPGKEGPVRRVAFVVVGGLDRVTGGNVYDGAAIEAMLERNWAVEIVEPPVPETLDADLAVVDSLAFRFGRPQTGIPYVALAHQVPSAVAGYPAPTVQERDVLRFASLVVTASDWLRDHLRAYTPAEVVAVHPGRDRAWAAGGRATDADAVLCVANASRGKGIPEAIGAFDRARLDDLHLLVVGDLDVDGDEATRVRTALEGVSRRVVTTGLVDGTALSRLYARGRVLLTASRYEGRPIAVLEAMASGLPVVGFDVPGLRELIRPGRDGLLARDGDVEDLARSLGDLFAEPGLADAMGRAARKRALEWPTWKETGARFAEAVAPLLDQVTRAP